MSSSKTKKYYQSFKDSYTMEFPCILKSNKGSLWAFCSDCRSDVNISHSGRGDIVSHMQTKKHTDNVKQNKNYPKIQNLFAAAEDFSVIRAECLFTAFLVEHNLPINCADHAGPLFRKMFPNCETAKKYGSARTKTTAIIKEMANLEECSIINSLRKQPFSLSTDASNDSESKLYPIVVTFFNDITSRIESNLLCVPPLIVDSTGRNIGELILKILTSRNIPIENCLSFGCDNANVMIGRKNGVAAVLTEAHSEIIIMGCLCHLIDLAAGRGAGTLPIKIDEIVVDIFYYFSKSSKRKEKFKQFQVLHDSDMRKILKHVETRWLSLGKCLNRILDQWAPLLSYFFEENSICNKRKFSEANLEVYKIPKINKRDVKHQVKNDDKCVKPSSSKSTSNKPDIEKKFKEPVKIEKAEKQNDRKGRIYDFLNSDLNKVLSLFLANVIPIFEALCIKLQSREPLIYKLKRLLTELFKSLLLRFVKPEIIKKSSSPLDVPYHQHHFQKDDNELIIGAAATKIVEKLKEEERIIFFNSVRKYFVTVLDYMRHSFPYTSAVLTHAEVLDISSISSAKFSSIKFFLDKFPILLSCDENETAEDAIDALQNEFCELQIEDIPSDVLNEERMDVKWLLVKNMKNALGTYKYKRLAETMISLLTIPHSNAECERIFSLVKKTRTEFRASLSNENLESLLITKCRAVGNCFEQNFSNSFLKKAKAATKISLAK